MNSKELKKWLRDNSSDLYRPSAEAADYIEHLERIIVEASTIKANVHIDSWDPVNALRDEADKIAKTNK